MTRCDASAWAPALKQAKCDPFGTVSRSRALVPALFLRLTAAHHVHSLIKPSQLAVTTLLCSFGSHTWSMTT